MYICVYIWGYNIVVVIFIAHISVSKRIYDDDTVINLIWVQMALLWWMALVLSFILSTENCLAAVDQNKLARIVNGILKK